MAKPTSAAIKANIQAQDAAVWNQAQARPDGLDLFEDDLAKAIAGAWADVESGLKIASVTVSGGSAGTGAPLSGGVAALTPGGLTSSASFTLISSKFKSSFPDGATSGLLALVDAVAQGIGQKFPAWVSGYSATMVASGGTCAWVPASGATPPAPGPWSGGSIESFALAGGSSAGDQGMTGASLQAAIGNAAKPSELKQNQNALQPALAALIAAIGKGFETTWTTWKANTKISGGNGSGTSAPITGATVGAVTNPTIS